ncbi:hypothetical protein [Methylosarcina fibrata]|uniref:hypothetical protein n=1 Tax=Methylosarcina fibrata TaxID=105972 RepID=UPI000368C924|nr:hypothetical protein [Methylosarcina fibrata]
MTDFADFSIENSTFTFRVNDGLKEQFAKLCKAQRISPSAALKLYMEDCLSEGYIRSSQNGQRSRANSRFGS